MHLLHAHHIHYHSKPIKERKTIDMIYLIPKGISKKNDVWGNNFPCNSSKASNWNNHLETNDKFVLDWSGFIETMRNSPWRVDVNVASTDSMLWNSNLKYDQSPKTAISIIYVGYTLAKMCWRNPEPRGSSKSLLSARTSELSNDNIPIHDDTGLCWIVLGSLQHGFWIW